MRRCLNFKFLTYSFLRGNCLSLWKLQFHGVLKFACETEYSAWRHVACRELWLESFLVVLKIEVLNPMSLTIDNKSNIDLETRFHILRDQNQMKKGRLQVVYCPIDMQRVKYIDPDNKSLIILKSLELFLFIIWIKDHVILC
jgi:hypothetical protein